MTGPGAGSNSKVLDTDSSKGQVLYLCDLPQKLSEADLSGLLEMYGTVVSLKQVCCAGEVFATVEYSQPAAAKEAREMLHHACLRQKTCRCLYMVDVEAIRASLDSHCRLVIEGLDKEIGSSALQDVCSLFGTVLDCKVELDEDGLSCGYGFVHYEDASHMSKALEFLNGMRLGTSPLSLREVEAADAWLFSGCNYAVSADDDTQHEALSRSFNYHHIEVMDDDDAKRLRLQELVKLYDPTGQQPMVIIANEGNSLELMSLLGSLGNKDDVAALSFQDTEAAPQRRKEVKKAYDAGNISVLVLSSDLSLRELDLQKPAAILVSFDFAKTFNSLLYRLAKLTGDTSRLHSFFSPTRDGKLASRLMAAIAEAGQDIPPQLLGLWTNQKED